MLTNPKDLKDFLFQLLQSFSNKNLQHSKIRIKEEYDLFNINKIREEISHKMKM
jgi:hypothetical protein